MRPQGPGAREGRRRLLDAPRLEVLPLASTAERVAHVPPGTTVTVTSSPRHGLEATVALVEVLARRGLDAVPHLAAAQVGGEAELEQVLDRLAAAGVRDLFVVGGDGPRRGGEFPDGLALLQAIDASGHSFERIGVPAYAEGHHIIDTETLRGALLAKQAYATYAVTQMCFDAAALIRLAVEARAAGFRLPFVAGVPGPVASAKLLRVGLRIGVGDSLRFLGGHRTMVRRLLHPRGYRPTRLVRRIEDLDQTTRHFSGLHIYTFNEVTPAVRWVEQLRRRPFDEELSIDGHAV